MVPWSMWVWGAGTHMNERAVGVEGEESSPPPKRPKKGALLTGPTGDVPVHPPSPGPECQQLGLAGHGQMRRQPDGGHGGRREGHCPLGCAECLGGNHEGEGGGAGAQVVDRVGVPEGSCVGEG